MADQVEGQQRDVPAFYTSSISLAASGTDIKIVFEDTVPATGAVGESEGVKHRVALVNMSFHTAKDLLALLGNALANVEAQLGTIDTPFLQKQKASAAE